MSTIEEIEQVIARLPPEDLERLSKWMAQRQPPTSKRQSAGVDSPFRDHRAFLNSYAPEDEGLYDHAAGR